MALDFATHWNELAPAVRAWCALQVRGPLGNAFDADDLEQEVCFQALRAFDGYDPALGSLRGWLFGVASKVAQHALRGLARARANAGPVEPLASRVDTLPAALTTISRRVRRDEALEHLLEAVSGLEELDRRIVVYRGLEGLSHEEVGQLLGLTTEAAKKRWQRALERLRQAPTIAGLFVDD